jgi:2'-5' RNA ligase
MFSLLLVPEEEAYTRLRALIERLSVEYGGPVFEPHILIVSGIDTSKSNAVAQASDVATEVLTLKTRLTKAAASPGYLKGVYLKVDYTTQLTELYQVARDTFGVSSKSYLPHLSVLCSHLPLETKQQVAASLGNDYCFSFQCRSLRLVNSREPNPALWDTIEEFSL